MPVEVVVGDVEHGGGVRRAASASSAAGSWTARRRGRRTARGRSTASTSGSADVAGRDGCAARPRAGSTSSICTVVVLPLVPVTASHGAGALAGRAAARPARPRPRPGRRARRPARAAARSARQPGRGDDEVDVVGQRRGRARRRAGPSAPRISSSVGLLALVARSADSSSDGDRGAEVRSGRRRRRSRRRRGRRRRRATPAQSRRAGSATSAGRRALTTPGHPLGVEEAEPDGDEEPGDDPEPDDDRDLVPARAARSGAAAAPSGTPVCR